MRWSFFRFRELPFLWGVGIFLFGGLVLSIVSLFEWCTNTCVEAHSYRFFGYPLDILGILFFALALFLWSIHTWYQRNTLRLLELVIASGMGAELWFLFIQYHVIGSFCPVCLSIAASLSLATLAIMGEGYKKFKAIVSTGESTMPRQARIRLLSSLFSFGIGLFIAVIGVFKPEQSFATGTSEKNDPIFGNRSSPVEVYFVSDWFCKACRKLEPSLDEMLPPVMEKASVIFVDRAIHPESLNYLPYNLSFMLKEKEKYFSLRKILSQLTLNNKSPTSEDVQKAVAPLGVTYKQLHFADLDSGVRYFQGIYQTFQVNSTPTVVIANKKKLEAKKLVGQEEITKENILAWIEKLK